MNKTLHLILKDLRFCRWWLGAWTAVCGLHLGLRLYQLRFGDTVAESGFWHSLETSDRWDWMVLRWLPLLIIPFFLHADPLVKRGAFWKGLPVRRSRLITAKLAIVLAFFVVLPLACEVVYFQTAGLSSMLSDALGAWAWRYLPLVVIVTAACFATPSMLWGLPAAAALYGLVGFWVLQPPSAGAPKEEHHFEVLESAPEGLRILVNDESVDVTSNTTTRVDPDTQETSYEERTKIELEIEARSLPEGIRIDRLFCSFDELHLGRQSVPIRQTLIVANSANQYGRTDSVPLQERGALVNGDGLRDLENLRRTWTVAVSRKMAARSIPLDGGELVGRVDAYLVKRVTVRRLDLGTDAIWHADGHRLHLDWHAGTDERSLDFTTSLYRPLLTDGRGHAASAASASWWPARTIPWVRHKTRSYGVPLGGARPVTFHDVTRMRDLRFATWNLSIENSLTPALAPLARLRFRDELSGPEHWELEFVRYEPAGRLEIPFRVKVRRPQSLPVLAAVEGDDLLTFPRSRASFLDDIRLPGEATEDECRTAFIALTELCAGAWGEFHDVKWKVDEILARIAADQPEILFDALRRHIRVQQREAAEAYDPRRFRRNLVHYQYQSSDRLWRERAGSLDGYWWHVRHALIATATEARKELYLNELSPRIDLLPVVERFDWIDEALPLMEGIAMHEPVPYQWRNLITNEALVSGSTRAEEAMERQIRLGAMEFYRVVDCFVTGPLEGERVANAAWDTTVEQAVEIAEVRDAFLLALKYGIDSAPRDLFRIMSGEMLKSIGESRRQRLLLLSMVQALAVHSDCPPDLAGASKWLEKHAFELAWNPVTRKYERAGGRVHEPFLDPSGSYGQWIDPMGVGTLEIEDGAIRLGTRAIPTWAGKMIYSRDIPRLMKPVSGDFTAEVTVDLPAVVAGTWSGEPQDVFSAAGLLMEAGRYHYTMIQRSFLGPEAKPHIEVFNSLPASHGDGTFEDPQWDPKKPLSLRLCRHGDWYFTAWRQGETEWVESEAFYNAHWEDEVRVGPFVSSGVVRPVAAVFKGFELRAGSEPPRHAEHGEFTTPGAEPTPDGKQLDRWGTVRTPLENGVVREQGKKLTIRPAIRHCTWSSGWRIAAPAVLRPVTGRFTYEVTVGPAPTEEGAAWSSAVAVVCTPDKTTSFKVGNGVFEPGKTGVNQRLWIHSYPRDNFHIPIEIDSTKPLGIRFQRDEHLLRIWLRPDGADEWTRIGEIPMHDWPETLEVGVAGVNAGPVDTLLEFRNPTLLPGDASASR